MILTDEEIKLLGEGTSGTWQDDLQFARAIEAAVIKNLREQEPVAWRFSKGTITKLDSWPHGGNWQPLYLHPKPPDAK